MSIRMDVQERFKRSAREMLALQDTYVACVNKVLVEHQNGKWSHPVRVRFEPNKDDGTVEIIMESVPE